MEKKKWNGFEDHFDFEKYQNKGFAELSRKYFIEMPDGSCRFIKIYTDDDNVSLAQIVAKGISAFLSNVQHNSYFPSLRLKLKSNSILDLDEIFKIYYEHCLIFLKNEENRKLFKSEKRLMPELINQHIEDEKQNYSDSLLIFKQLKDSEIQVFEQINKAVLKYPEWIKVTHPEVNSIPKTFLATAYSEIQLKTIRKRLIDNKIIEDISDTEFLYLFTGKPINKTMKRLLWNMKRTLGHSFLEKVVFSDKEFDFKQINECITSKDGKLFDSNNKSTSQYRNDDILNLILQF